MILEVVDVKERVAIYIYIYVVSSGGCIVGGPLS